MELVASGASMVSPEEVVASCRTGVAACLVEGLECRHLEATCMEVADMVGTQGLEAVVSTYLAPSCLLCASLG